MKYILFIALLFSSNLFAETNPENKPETEIQHLNAFPKLPQVFRFEFIMEESDIQAKDLRDKEKTIKDDHQYYIFGYGRALSKNKFLVVKLPFIKSFENEVKASGNTGNTYRSKGFREPSFGYFVEYKSAEKVGDTIRHYSIEFTPSILDKKSGTKNSNRAVGGHELKFTGSRGARYTKWEARGVGEFSFFFNKKEKNLDSGVEYTQKPFYQYTGGIEIQYAYSDTWYFNTGSGIQFVQDTHINSSDTKGGARIQLGTGSIGYVGVTCKHPKAVYKARIFRSKNDFFVSAPKQNFKGEFTKFYLNFEYTKEF